MSLKAAAASGICWAIWWMTLDTITFAPVLTAAGFAGRAAGWWELVERYRGLLLDQSEEMDDIH